MGNCLQQGIFGDRSLPTTYITLQQSVHRNLLAHVMADFLDRLLLISSQLERKQAGDPRVDLGTARQRRSTRAFRSVPTTDSQRQLQYK